MLRGSMPAMNQKVFSIAPGSVILTIVILVGAYTLWFLRDLVLLVLTAIVSVLLMYVLVLGAVFGFLYALVPPILEDAEQFISVLPDYLETIELPQSITTATETAGRW